MSSDPTGKRLLFVDDEPLLCRAFKRSMGRLGYLVDVANSPQEAIRLARESPYPVVVTDLRLPTMSGVSLIKQLQPDNPNTAFIILTGAPDIDLGRPTDDGVNIASILAKPVDAKELVEVIERARQMMKRSTRAPQVDGALSNAVGDVLLVEDNVADADMLRILLEKMGWAGEQVAHVERLDDALAILGRRTFGLLLTDLSLPDARGHDAIARLHRTAPTTPIVVLSGTDDEEVALQALELGAQDYLSKNSLNSASLLRTIRHSIERKRVEQRLTHLAHYDHLTGLANRARFRERMLDTVARAKRRGDNFSVLMLDLDRFKTVNDTLGHDMGDRLLTTVAKRLQESVRDSDTVARLGGDEFAVLLDAPTDEAGAVLLAGRILDSLREPTQLRDERFVTTSSIGVAVYPRCGDTMDTLMTSADEAMYVAKKAGRNCVRVFSSEQSTAAQQERKLEQDLHQALTNSEFVLHYQPQYGLDGGAPLGVEALLRWARPGHGLVPPLEFVPLLEKTGLIREVGRWVLRTAMAQLAQWDAGNMRLAVNISPLQFEEDGLVEYVATLLQRTAVSPACLELEITETILMRDTVRSRRALTELKRLGVRIAIDDFGTGHSSLGYLTRFGVDVLKIDRSFVHNLTAADDSARKVAAAVIALGHNLGLEVVAEGIETDEQLDVLRDENCDMGQGFLLGRPTETPILAPVRSHKKGDSRESARTP